MRALGQAAQTQPRELAGVAPSPSALSGPGSTPVGASEKALVLLEAEARESSGLLRGRRKRSFLVPGGKWQGQCGGQGAERRKPGRAWGSAGRGCSCSGHRSRPVAARRGRRSPFLARGRRGEAADASAGALGLPVRGTTGDRGPLRSRPGAPAFSPRGPVLTPRCSCLCVRERVCVRARALLGLPRACALWGSSVRAHVCVRVRVCARALQALAGWVCARVGSSAPAWPAGAVPAARLRGPSVDAPVRAQGGAEGPAGRGARARGDGG